MFGMQAKDLRRFADLASPSFFDVIPVRALWRQGRALLASTRDSAGFSRLCQRAAATLDRLGASVEIGEGDHVDPRAPIDPQARGEAVLRVYFAQLAHLDATILDLRLARFCAAPAGDSGPVLRWTPTPLSVTWDPDFIDGVRGLYTGFYRDDTALFERSAQALGLSVATDLFRQQFGAGDQTAVRFELDRFKQSFHEIFVRCQEHGATFHPNFVALGIYLGGLYEHLDALGVPLDVRRAFDAVWPRALPDPPH